MKKTEELTAAHYELITQRAKELWQKALADDPMEFRPEHDPGWSALAAHHLKSEGKLPK